MRQTLLLLCAVFSLLVLRAEERGRVYTPEQVPNVQLRDSTQLLSDPTGYIAPEHTAQLNARLRDIRSRYGVEFAVVVLPSIGSRDLESYSTELFRLWGLGEQKQDNGLLLLLCIEQNQGRFEVGYGLEGSITDASAGRVWRQYMVPHLRSGDYAGALLAGTEAIASLLERSDERAGASSSDEGRGQWQTLLWLYVIFGFGVSLFSFSAVHGLAGQITSPEAARRQLPHWKRSSRESTLLILVLCPPLALLYIPWAMGTQRRLQRLAMTCPQCGKPHLQAEPGSIPALTPYQQIEQRIGSRRYTGLCCTSCRAYVVSAEDVPGTPFRLCHRCGSLAVRVLPVRYVYDAAGRRLIRRQTQCLCCDDTQMHDERDRSDGDAAVLAGLGALVSLGRSFGRSGGGFSGGSSGGGGFSGRW